MQDVVNCGGVQIDGGGRPALFDQGEISREGFKGAGDAVAAFPAQLDEILGEGMATSRRPSGRVRGGIPGNSCAL